MQSAVEKMTGEVNFALTSCVRFLSLPLSAGTIDLAGVDADSLFGVMPAMAGFPESDSNGRCISPEIKSVNSKPLYGRMS